MTEKLLEKLKICREAPRHIDAWELPPTGEFWADGTPASYGDMYGSNGERDYMRDIARKALKRSEI